jgi:hypothetical protein
MRNLVGFSPDTDESGKPLDVEGLENPIKELFQYSRRIF